MYQRCAEADILASASVRRNTGTPVQTFPSRLQFNYKAQLLYFCVFPRWHSNTKRTNMMASIQVQQQLQIQVSSATTLACWNSILTTKNYHKHTLSIVSATLPHYVTHVNVRNDLSWSVQTCSDDVRFYPRDADAMLARVLAVIVCLCVCHKPVLYRDARYTDIRTILRY